MTVLTKLVENYHCQCVGKKHCPQHPEDLLQLTLTPIHIVHRLSRRFMKSASCSLAVKDGQGA